MNQSLVLKRIVIDLDLTLTAAAPDAEYHEKPVNVPVAERLREYKAMGYAVTIFTARNMRTYDGNLELIRANTLPIIEGWLTKNDIPYDEIVIGKPWCGTHGFYVDDRAVRPDEFAALSPDYIQRLLQNSFEKSQCP